MIEELYAIIKKEEGLRLTSYWDKKRFSIGYGTYAEREGQEITEREAERRMKLKVDFAFETEFFRLGITTPAKVNQARRVALSAMIYQLGLNGVKGFKKMIEAINKDDWNLAGYEALQSKWTEDTPARARRMAKIIKEGVL